MILGVLDFQTFSDAVGLGALYALMAVGIGLVFGVLRLVNFAYGQLIMAGAYTLAYTSSWPVAWSIVACFGVVIALSLLMERAVFRPLREQSPTVMLVTTFAISFVLQSIALLIDIRDGQIGEPAPSLTSLNVPISIDGVDVRKVTIVAVLVAIGALGALALLLGRTEIGLRTRAAAADFRTARLLGVKANQVIGLAVVLSGALAATVAVILTLVTALEVGVIYIRFLTPIVVPLLLVMAAAKFALVVMFFMHLRYDARPLTTLFLGPLIIASLLGVALMTLTGAFLIFGR